MLVHAFEESGLRLGGCSIDLVGQDHLCHDRSRSKFELAILLVVDRHASDIAREKVRGELDPFEAATNRSRDRFREYRFTDTRDVLDQDVPLADQRDNGELDRVAFTNDDLLDISNDLLG
jgi:hypothetical protein